MDIKSEVAKMTPKFEGIHIHAEALQSRLHVTVEAEASIDLPGDLDSLIATGANALLGKYLPGKTSEVPSEVPSEALPA